MPADYFQLVLGNTALFPTDNALRNRRTIDVRLPAACLLAACWRKRVSRRALQCSRGHCAPAPSRSAAARPAQLPGCCRLLTAPVPLPRFALQLVRQWSNPAAIGDFFAAFEESYIKMTSLNVVSCGKTLA